MLFFTQKKEMPKHQSTAKFNFWFLKFILSACICYFSETLYTSAVSTSTWPSNQYWVKRLKKGFVFSLKNCLSKNFMKGVCLCATLKKFGLPWIILIWIKLLYKPVVLNVGSLEAHYFRWETFCSPPCFIKGISRPILPSNHNI